jgi:hypothetical protein
MGGTWDDVPGWYGTGPWPCGRVWAAGVGVWDGLLALDASYPTRNCSSMLFRRLSRILKRRAFRVPGRQLRVVA